MWKSYVFILFCCLVYVHGLEAQADDNVLWASIKLKKSVSEKTTVALTPIMRINHDISNYQNTSIDVSLHRKLGDRWGVQLLSRTFFNPDDDVVQFVWFDIDYSKSIKLLKIKSRLRYHQALDLFDKINPDYIRWYTSATPQFKGKIKPFVAIAPWLRLNGANRIERMRYEVGATFSFNTKNSLLCAYRREDIVNLDYSRNFNMYLVTLTHEL